MVSRQFASSEVNSIRKGRENERMYGSMARHMQLNRLPTCFGNTLRSIILPRNHFIIVSFCILSFCNCHTRSLYMVNFNSFNRCLYRISSCTGLCAQFLLLPLTRKRDSLLSSDDKIIQKYISIL